LDVLLSNHSWLIYVLTAMMAYLKMIRKMRVSGNVSVWFSNLGVCKVPWPRQCGELHGILKSCWSDHDKIHSCWLSWRSKPNWRASGNLGTYYYFVLLWFSCSVSAHIV
jgi:hypothetical protein